MKKYIIIILFILACSSSEGEKNIPEFDGNIAYQYIIDQCDFGPRNPGSTGHQQFANFLESYLLKNSDKVIIQDFNYLEHITGEDRVGKNLIAQFNLEDEERLLIGAHWDTRAVADEDPNPDNRSIPILGANDGASGTAVLMELATIFSNNPPPIGIDLVFFDEEDVGISSFEDDFNDSLQLSRITRSFTPLIGISTSFKNGVSTNIRSNVTHTLDEVATGLTYISDNSILATITYNFSKGIRFELPFTDRNINLRNNMNISLNFDFSNKKEEGSKDKINFVEQNFSNTRKSILRITYTLTDDVTGSLFYEYRENDTRLTGRRIDRDFGINLNVAIRG